MLKHNEFNPLKCEILYHELTKILISISCQTKLQRGNVFTSVCLLKWGSICTHYLWCIGRHCTGPPALPLRHQTIRYGTAWPWHPGHQTWDHGPWLPANDIWWPSLENCSNLFIWGPHWYGHLAAQVRTVGKRAACILLKCLLVN